MRYVATVENGICTSKGINYTGFVDDREMELTEEQYNTIHIPCKLVDGEFIPCEFPKVKNEDTPTETEPTEIEQLRADIDYIALMKGVDL